MSNVKFHVEARTNPEITEKYSNLFLYTSLSLATLAFGASVFALAVAATVLTGGLAAVAITGCTVAALASSYGFFKAYNALSAKNLAQEMKKFVEERPLVLHDSDGMDDDLSLEFNVS